MNENKPSPWYIWACTMFLAWLGLAGFADNLLEWREWFEVGIMEHWRAVKFWMTETLLFWIPFDVPSWVVDYLLLGGVFVRPHILQSNQKAEARALDEMRRQKVKTYVVQRQTGIPLVWIVPTLLFWPVVFFDDAKDLISNRISGVRNPQIEATLKMFLMSIIYFLPLLFVATDVIGTLGL